MADTPTFQSNPYGSFDPSQFTNPYSNFYGKALPWPSSYAGTPSDALGRPIAAPQGVTLNQTPAQPQPASSGLNSTQQWWNALSQPSAMNPSGNAALGMANWGAFMGPQGAIDRTSPGFLQPGMQGYQGQGGAQGAAPGQAAPQAAAPAPPNNWQQTLAMLANPGKVTTPGAQVPQAPSSAQPGPGVLQSFLANWNPAQSGPGSQFQNIFAKNLRGT